MIKHLGSYLPLLILTISVPLLSFDASPEPHLPRFTHDTAPNAQEVIGWLLSEPVNSSHPERIEAILDLVKVATIDSVLLARRQHHQLPAGDLLSVIGFNWSALKPIKQKMIGTLSKPIDIYDGPGDEFDLNLDVIPHLGKYVNLFVGALEETRATGRSMRHCVHAPSATAPNELRFDNQDSYAMGCELTLPEQARASMGEKLLQDFQSADHRQPLPSLGLYGPLVMDCNHNCRPEIHPFQWMWWLAPSETGERIWNVMLTTDGSGRFTDWVKGNMEGDIILPMAWFTASQRPRVELRISYWDGRDTQAWEQQMEEMTIPFSDGTTAPMQIQYPIHPSAKLEVKVEDGDHFLPGINTASLHLHVQARENFTAQVVVR